MISTLEAKEMNLCQQAKDSVRNVMGRYLAFASMCLYDERFIGTMNSLLPFDHFARAKLTLRGVESKIKSLGVSVMRMDFEPSVFSLGISIEIEGGNRRNDTTILISAYRTLEQLREYVQTDDFEKVVSENFEKQIEISFARRPENADNSL